MKAGVVNYARARDGVLYLAPCVDQRQGGHLPSLEAREEGDWQDTSTEPVAGTTKRYWRMAKGRG